MEDIRDLRSGKTSPERSRPTRARTSDVSLKACAGSRTKPFLFLDVKNGQTQERYWQTVSPSPGECLTHNTGESPREENASSLSQILIANAPEKYCLSPKACRGILQRASKRGKELPPLLKAALLERPGWAVHRNIARYNRNSSCGNTRSPALRDGIRSRILHGTLGKSGRYRLRR